MIYVALVVAFVLGFAAGKIHALKCFNHFLTTLPSWQQEALRNWTVPR
jgi:hypothetical protein